jgi:hypothetical protein
VSQQLFFWVSHVSNMHTNRIGFMFKQCVFSKILNTEICILPIASRKIFACTRETNHATKFLFVVRYGGVDYQFLELSIHTRSIYIRVSVLYSTKSQFRKSRLFHQRNAKASSVLSPLGKTQNVHFFFAVTQNTKFKAIVYSHSTTSLR